MIVRKNLMVRLSVPRFFRQGEDLLAALRDVLGREAVTLVKAG